MAGGQLVQATQGNGTTLSVTTNSFANPTTPGNLIVVGVGFYTGVANSLTGVSDSKGNTFAQSTGSPGTPTTNAQLYAFIAPIGTGGSTHTITATQTNPSGLTIIAGECSGIALSSPVRSGVAAGTTAGSTSHAGGTVTAAAGDLVVCLSCDDARASDTFTAGSGFAIPTNGQFGTALVCMMMQVINNAAAGNYTGLYTTVQFAGYSQVIMALHASSSLGGSGDLDGGMSDRLGGGFQ